MSGKGGGRFRREPGHGENRWQPRVHNNFELRLPPGWEDCPPFGEPMKLPDNSYFQVIPSKVPLHQAYNRLLRDQRNAYSLRQAVDMAQRRFNIKIGMVLDLTNSFNYYSGGEECAAMEMLYVKVPCRGRGEVPNPEAVNHAVFEMYRLWDYYPAAYVFMHCTHGFNRTGYVLACAAVRLAGNKGMSIDRAVRRFAESRAPGIYKDSYINELFRYHHEKRLPHIQTPPTPAWKGVDNDDDEDPDAVEAPVANTQADITHERIEDIGEPVPFEEADFVKKMVYQMLTGHEPPESGHVRFPGSQPVSLASSNMHLIEEQRYWVSWKADGTRYLLLIMERGCYLIDRSYKVVRLQMRFPTPGKLSAPKPPDTFARGEYPVGRPHSLTLLDGEMVVDTVDSKKYRRYLVYDMAVLNTDLLIEQPWIKRFKTMEDMVVAPRNKERQYILGQIDPKKERYKMPALQYDYTAEPFSVRKKDFWPLYRAKKVIQQLIPVLSHEADGLILQMPRPNVKCRNVTRAIKQSCESGYVANTDNALLKFKFAHLNSVDFKLQVIPTPSGHVYTLWLMDSRGRRPARGAPPKLTSIETPVEFPEVRVASSQTNMPKDVDGPSLADAIIECTWVPEHHCWRYLRTRVDKDTPNAYHVYEKVMQSIYDNIHEDKLVEYLAQVYWNVPVYEKDRSNKEVTPLKDIPEQLPPPPSADFFARLPGPPERHDQEENYHEQEPGLQVAPWSPPYYGPEPTPPHDPDQPFNPILWPPHSPSKYPAHLLPLPPPPPLHDMQDGMAGVHDQQDYLDDSQIIPDPDVCPYYVPDEGDDDGFQPQQYTNGNGGSHAAHRPFLDDMHGDGHMFPQGSTGMVADMLQQLDDGLAEDGPGNGTDKPPKNTGGQEKQMAPKRPALPEQSHKVNAPPKKKARAAKMNYDDDFADL